MVIDRMYELVRWYLGHLTRFPRSQRYGLGARLEQNLYAVLEGLIEARYSTPQNRGTLLDGVNRRIQVVRMFTRLADEMQLLPHKSHAFAARELNEIGNMVGGWLQQHQRRMIGND